MAQIAGERVCSRVAQSVKVRNCFPMDTDSSLGQAAYFSLPETYWTINLRGILNNKFCNEVLRLSRYTLKLFSLEVPFGVRDICNCLILAFPKERRKSWQPGMTNTCIK